MKIFDEFDYIKYKISSSLDVDYLSRDTLDIVDIKEFITDEPSCYINQLELNFYGIKENSQKEIYIGDLFANHIKINEVENNDDVGIFDVYDSVDTATFNLYESIYDIESGFIREDIDIGANNDILFIYDLVIDPNMVDLDVPELILKRLPNILRYSRDIWLGAIFYGTHDVNMRRILLESGYHLIEDTNYLYTNPEELGYYEIDFEIEKDDEDF
ncbi:MAG: hypothetical protein ABF289_19880 [Clostridiales bacterium]